MDVNIKRMPMNCCTKLMKQNLFIKTVFLADVLYSVCKNVKARGCRGVKMPYFDFSICYRAGKNEQDAKNGRLI